MVANATSRATAARHKLLTTTHRPPKTEVVADAIPEAIRGEKRWVCWEWKRAKSKWTKRPVQPDGKAASSTDAATWTTFAEAMLAHQRSPDIAGVGFVLGGGWAGVDLDSCVDPETGDAAEHVADACERFDSYTEISPSKTGVKILCKGVKPKGRTQSPADAEWDVECYDSGRFFTITGQRYRDTPATVEHRTEALEWFFATYIDPQRETAPPPEAIKPDWDCDDIEMGRQALANIPASYASGYADWVRVGIACRSVHPEALRDDWRAWSRDGAGYQGDDDCRAKWDTLPTDGAVGVGTLIYLARLNGWSPPRKTSRPKASAPKPDDGRPEVLVELDEGVVAETVVEHLGRLGWASPWIPGPLRESVKLYSRMGQLVHAVPGDDPGSEGQLAIRPMPSPLVRERVTQACQTVVERETKDGVDREPVRPPKWLIEAIHHRGSYGNAVRPLVGIVVSPTIRADGTILQTPGYDDATGLLYRPSTTFPVVPESPSQDDAAAAAGDLLEVVSDFPFVTDGDRAAWVCLVLTLLGRPAVAGRVPLIGVTATTPGTGKGLSVNAASLIAYGHAAPCETFPRTDEELGKRITAHAIEATPCVVFDNVATKLGGDNLDAVLTADRWRGRVLGSSKNTAQLPITTVFVATGNNLQFGSDIARRVLPIRMATDDERPEDRTDFRHRDLPAWVAENRPRLAVAALTILRAYHVAGCPQQPGGQWGSFEAWSRVIRGAAVWAGLADPMETRETARESDDSQATLAMLLHGLAEADPDGEGLTAKEIERLASHRPDEPPTCPTLVEAVSQVCGDRPNARRIGARLRNFAGRVCDGRRIVAERGHGNVTRWAVRCQVNHRESAKRDMGDMPDSGFSHVPHHVPNTSPRKTRDETSPGGHGGLHSSIQRHREEKGSFPPEGREKTGQEQSGDPPEPCPPCPPSPPGPPPAAPPLTRRCRRCGGVMERLPETPVVGGYVNVDCTTPGCNAVMPVRLTEGVSR